MNSKTKICKNEYELHIVSLKFLIKKKFEGKQSFKNCIRQEIEKVYPFLDLQSQIFYQLVIVKKALCIAVVIIEAGILQKYGNSKKLYIDDTVVVKLIHNKKKVLSYAAACAFIIVVLSSVPIFHSSYSTVDSNPLIEEIVIQQIEKEENDTIIFSELIDLLVEMYQKKEYTVESISIEYKSSDEITEVVLSVTNIFPETLLECFSEIQRKQVSVGNISYNENIPSYCITVCTNAPVTVNNGLECLNIRNIILESKGSLICENENSQNLKASFSSNSFHLFLDRMSETTSLEPIKNIVISKNDDQYELSIDNAENSITPFVDKEFIEFLNTFFKQKKQKQILNTRKKEIKNTNNIIGKILQENGDVKIFYRTSDGKLVSEVEK